jgi:hypothetical protein
MKPPLPFLFLAVSCASTAKVPEAPPAPAPQANAAPAPQPRASGKPEIRYYEISDA